mgnify:FL=1|tara:strand:- start:35 stop:391 length:357 start_codon:yes stop_codon:yes gene_type:complete
MAVEIGKKFPKIKWGEKTINGIDATFKWNTAPNNPTHPRYTWDEVELIQHAAGDAINEPWQQWEDNKKEKLIKLICKVQGKTYKNTKSIKDYKIKISDVKLVAKKVLGIEIMTENVKF